MQKERCASPREVFLLIFYALCSIRHYNDLVDMEEEYATFCRNLNQGFEELAKTDHVVNVSVKNIIGTHDRRSLSKKLPLTLFSPTFPASLSKFKK